MTELKPQGLVNELNAIQLQSITKKARLAQLKEDLKETELHQAIELLEGEIKVINKEEDGKKDILKGMMIKLNSKKIEALNGQVIQLNKKPGKLIIEDESLIPDEYRKTKTTTTIDKKDLKEDIKQGVVIEGVSIEEDYTLVIKN